MDNVTPATRSRIMKSVRSADTKPERALRSALWARGLRFRKHDRTVTGRPDLSHKGRRVAVFVDGCFWHGCPRCYAAPASNVGFWQRKLRTNIQRRNRVRKELASAGWRVVEIWECEMREMRERIVRAVARALAGTSASGLNRCGARTTRSRNHVGDLGSHNTAIRNRLKPNVRHQGTRQHKDLRSTTHRKHSM